MKPTSQTSLLTKSECAHDGRVSVRTIEREIRDGHLSVCRIGARTLIPRLVWERYLSERIEGGEESAAAVA